MTAAFLAAYAQSIGRELYGLVELRMPASSGAFVDLAYFATREVITPAGGAFTAQLWQKGVLRFGPVHAQGAFGTNEVAPVTFTFSLENRSYALSTGAVATLDSIMQNHYLQGTTVIARLWEDSLGSFGDAAQWFRGVITDVENQRDRTVFACKQRSDWNRDIVVKTVNLIDHPNADAGAVGNPIPTRYGSIKGVPMIVPPYPSAYGTSGTGTTHLRRDLCHGVRGAAKCVLVDVGRGSTASKGKVLAAAHKIKSIGVPAAGPWGTSIGFVEGDRLSLWDAASSDWILASSGSGFYVPDSFDQVHAPVYPVDVKAVGGSSPIMPRAVLDPYSPDYCRLDQTNKVADFALPATGDLGEASAVGLIVCYRTSAGAAALKAKVYGSSGGSILTLAASTSIIVAELTISTPPIWDPTLGLPDAPYDFPQSTLEVYFDAGSSGTADIFFAGLRVLHKGRRTVIVPDRIVRPGEKLRKVRQHVWRRAGVVPPGYTPDGDQIIKGVTEAQGQFFANLEGYMDDGEFDSAGAFTAGASGTLIERAPDIAQHLLVVGGKEPPANLERGTGVHGSFVDARAAAVTWRQGPMPFTLKISKTTPVFDALHDLARDAVAWVYLCPYTDKWKWVPWNMGAPVNFRLAFAREDLGPQDSFIPSMTPAQDVLTGITLRYLHDEFTDGYLYETHCKRSSSLSGYEFLNQRDQALACITGINDSIDWWDGTTNRTATIAGAANPGTRYDGPGLLAVLRTGLKASLDYPNTLWSVGFGTLIVAGVNDKFYWNDGATRVATLAPGYRATMELLAADLQAAVNAVAGTYTVTYSRVSKKHLITKSAGTFSLSAGTAQDSALATFGFSAAAHGAATSWQGDAAVEEELVVIASDRPTFELRWRSGTNGWANAVATNIKTAAPLLGYWPADDATGAKVYGAFSPRGGREAMLELAASRYGEHAPLEIDSTTIRSSETAREVRNRIIDMMSKPRVQVQFQTHRAPDLERGHVIAFSADLDGYYRGYPEPGSDGLWAGKRFVVVEVEHSLGPQSCATKVVAVSLG